MKINIKPDDSMTVEKRRVHNVPLLILRPAEPKENAPGILWIHGGGYFLGMKEMVYMSRAKDLVRKFGAVVVSPGYRLAFQAPYPAAVKDCYLTLDYMKTHAEELGIDPTKLIVGGESAGGGLAAAVCLLARDLGRIKVAFQLPLYPMLSNIDTASSKDNHGRIWNTRRNHLGWKMYLRRNAKNQVSPYASPIWEKDYSGLPPAYTFVGDGEPFYAETLEYVRCLKRAGVPAQADVYHTNVHAFDMLYPDAPVSKKAISRFEERFGEMLRETERTENRDFDKKEKE